MQIALSIGEVEIVDSALRLGPRSGAIVRRHPPSASPGSRAANVHRRDDEFRRGAEQLASRPSRIDFGVTERCNLRCRHCLAFAPQRTAAGTARTMTPWLLDRLRGDLPHVAYSCIGDLGEALTSPMLFDLLAALRGTPVVHLLTNGLLLDAEVALRLTEAGVRSIMVSLDGATAVTSDAIRTGAAFERVVSNLRRVAELRRVRSLDLRLGVSCVVTRTNLGELEDLAVLSAQLGLDWVKFDELVPVSGLAPDLASAAASDASTAAVRRAVARAQQLGLHAVDHTLARTFWRCRLEASPEHAEFLAADEFANRTEIHPCRVAWEHVCVAANGDVRLGDLFGPLLGNLAEQDLTAIWNGPAVRAERRRAIRGRACGAGPVMCLA
jgi:MoaA/NifB/PqqE/SkfB family radical SAM enzyme